MFSIRDIYLGVNSFDKKKIERATKTEERDLICQWKNFTMKSAVGQQRELRWGDGYGVQRGDKTIVRLLAFITRIQQVMRPTRFESDWEKCPNNTKYQISADQRDRWS